MLKVPQRSVSGMDVGVIRDIVAVVFPGRRAEWENPKGGYSQVFQVREPLRQPAKVSHPVAIAILECANVNLIDNRILVPKRVRRKLPVRIILCHLSLNCAASLLPKRL